MDGESEEVIWHRRYDGGDAVKKTVVLLIPMLLGNIAQQMYNTVVPSSLAGMSGIMPWRRSGALVRSSSCCLYCSPELR